MFKSALSVSKGALLSCSKDPADSAVYLAPGDGSAHDVWKMTPVAKDTYVVTSEGDRGERATLSCTASGGGVDVFARDDGSGRQRWKFLPVGDGKFSVSVSAGLDDADAKFLTADESSRRVSLAPAAPGYAGQAFSLGGGSSPIPDPAHPTPAPTPAGTPVPPSAVAALAKFGMSELQIDAVQSLVACPENSTTDWKSAYGFAKFLGDGRGITFGIVGFCSGTGDGAIVLKRTAAADPSCPVSKYAPAMAKTRGENRSGLDGFEAAAKASAQNVAFRESQWSVAIEHYWNFAREYCTKAANRPGPVLESPLALGLMYDTALNHGGSVNSFNHIVKKMRNPGGGTEGAWIKDFCAARKALLKSGFQDLDTSGTGDRANIWAKLVDEGNWTLERPIRVARGYWGNDKKIL
jgi:hypothetical protein